ncbi:ANTAR domain-containing protein [Blastococcus sp. BMG 814]|uniref:ANTAR domain-containing protein n=1 Tax=Blastococcus carthaginiensis TaxID=3050034 RepID=A0ABT9IEQ4_9ACTN|nr:ANTAR domain-containing protein [Blastococcus carthaginiensis]MDP5184067.1 ANTAR domain-containing protein [Blastococcus carthaginiensis]
MSSPPLTRSRPAARPAHDRGQEARRTVTRHPVPSPGIAGRYRFDGHAGTWWWSPEMHDLLGLDAAGTTPSTEALLRVQRPEDGARLLAALSACGAGQAFAVETRLHHPDRPPRPVLLVGEPGPDGAGGVRAVEGLCVDLTGARSGAPDPAGTDVLRTEVEQLRTAMASRAVIEQAKGILMLLTGCAEQTAFDLLAHISSHTHRKVRDVAQAITASATGHGGLPEDVRAILRDACPPG